MISAGTRLGPYEVLARLGAGGMGEVWRARDTRLDRSVAIKIVAPEFAQRFDREAKSISALNHPHICTLYDVGPNYLVMELLEGESLADRLAKGPLPMEQVLRYGTQIADALDKAHRQGIIHRDLKPGNVMITKGGAKLLDFGLAKDSAPAALAGTTVQKPLTQEGQILGTFQYMAPEQLEGIPADARTDIFALGAVLYEMVTGRRAFDGKTKTSLIAAIVSGDPAPMSTIQPLTLPAFEHVARKCLAKDPDDRWQSAHDVAEQLRWISEAGSQAGVAAPLIARKKNRERLGWAAAVVVALVAGLLGSRGLHREQPVPYRFSVAMIGKDFRFGSFPQLSPDGRTLYFRATTPDGIFKLFRRRLDEFEVKPIDGTDNVSLFAVMPDGRNLLLLFSGAVVKKIAADGGPLQPVADAVEGGLTFTNGVAIASNGTILVGGAGIRRLVGGSRVEWLIKVDGAHGQSCDFPLFLPGDQRFLFIESQRDANRGTVERTLCAGTLGSKEITRIGEMPTRFAYALGHIFFIRGGTLVAQPFDTKALKFTGDAEPVAEDVGFNARSGDGLFSVAPNGTIAFKNPDLASSIVSVDASGRKLGTIVGAGSLTAGRFAIVPGREEMILALADVRAGVVSLWIRDLTRGSATRLTQSSAAESNPVISPDGKRVFFITDLARGPRIFQAPIDQSEPPRLAVAASAGVQVPNDMSRDGRFLLYQSNEHQVVSKQDLWVLPLTGAQKPFPFLATPAIEVNGAFSPDGKWIAYASDIDTPGTLRVYVRPFPGAGAPRPVSTQRATFVRFSRDGKRLYFSDREKLYSADFHADGSVGQPQVAFELDDSIQAFEQLPDGKFVMSVSDDAATSGFVHVITGWHPAS